MKERNGSIYMGRGVSTIVTRNYNWFIQTWYLTKRIEYDKHLHIISQTYTNRPGDSLLIKKLILIKTIKY